MLLEHKQEVYSTQKINDKIAIIKIKHVITIGTDARMVLLETQHKNYNKTIGSITLDSIRVDEDKRGSGLSKVLLKKFGELYVNVFNNYSFEVFWANPLAEYSFLKSVENGDIPQSILNKSNVIRSYLREELQLWSKLKTKLKYSFH